MSGIPVPEGRVAVALASIAVHAGEALGPGGHDLDLAAIRGLLSLPSVQAYLAELDALGLLPLRREARHRAEDATGRDPRD